MHVSLYVCKRTHDIGQNPSAVEFSAPYTYIIYKTGKNKIVKTESKSDIQKKIINLPK